MVAQIDIRNEFISDYLVDHPENASIVLGKLNAKQLSDVLNRFEPETLGAALNLLQSSEIAQALTYVGDDRSLSLIKQLSPNLVASILRSWMSSGNTSESDRAEMILAIPDAKFMKAVKNLLLFPDGTVGSLMNPVPFSATDGITVDELLSLLKRERHRYSRYVYIVDDKGTLQGVLPFKDAFYADGNATLAQLMTAKIVSLRPELSAVKAIENPAWKKWNSLPVVDVENKLLGVIREDVLEDHTSEDLERKTDHEEIIKAAAAVGEVLQIAVTGTASAFGFKPRN